MSLPRCNFFPLPYLPYLLGNQKEKTTRPRDPALIELGAGYRQGRDVVHLIGCGCGLAPVFVQFRLELVDKLHCYHRAWQGVPVIDSCTECIPVDKHLVSWLLELPLVTPCSSYLDSRQEGLWCHCQTSSERLIHSHHVASSSAIIQRRHPDSAKSFRVREMLDRRHHSCCTSLHPFQSLLATFSKRFPDRVAEFEERSDHGLEQQWERELVDVS